MRLVTAEQMKRIDAAAIEGFGIPGVILMENAALAVVREVRNVLPGSLQGKKLLILAAKGNNGGDGFAIARQLYVAGMEVHVFLAAAESDLQGDAAFNLRLYKNLGGNITVIGSEKQLRLFKFALLQSDVVVDALYGIGFRGSLPESVRPYVEELNHSDVPVIAADIPSGLEANTGKVNGLAVKAAKTVTFGLPKIGLYLGQGPLYTGEVIVDQISIPETVLGKEIFFAYLLSADIATSLIPRRHPHGHKGTHGRGVIIGGSKGMSGAVILAGKAALRSGIGLLQLVVPEEIAELADAGVPEATVWTGQSGAMLGEDAWPAIAQRLRGASACAVGPGLKQDKTFLKTLENILNETEVPAVLDADALNLAAKKTDLLLARRGQGNLILTPHPGEMARLCGISVAQLQETRIDTTMEKAQEWGSIIVLKGANTVIASPDGRVFVNTTGNAGLGTGGTGDVLTGTILAWMAQGVPPLGAACLGVYLHGLAGDFLKKQYGLSGYTAMEVAETLPSARKAMEENI